MSPAQMESTTLLLAGLPGPTSSDPVLTTAVIRQYLSEGQNQLWRASLAVNRPPRNLRTRTTLNLAVGVNSVNWPLDFGAVLKVKAKDGSGNWTLVRHATREDLDAWEGQNWESQANGNSIKYYYHLRQIQGTSSNGGLVVGLWPVPAYTAVGGLGLSYLRAPTDVATWVSTYNTSMQVVDIPSRYHDALCHYAVWRHLLSQREQPRQDYGQYAQVFERARADYVNENAESAAGDYWEDVNLGLVQNQWYGYWKRL